MRYHGVSTEFVKTVFYQTGLRMVADAFSFYTANFKLIYGVTHLNREEDFDRLLRMRI
ncbi:MAG: hypothetical protein LC664_01970 [Flavobacteriales bacterium]|nr:hypothetical protein [Flavobacteriales bacterium]